MVNYKKGPILIRHNFGSKFLEESDFGAWLPTTILDEILLEEPTNSENLAEDMSQESLGSKIKFKKNTGLDIFDTIDFFNLRTICFNEKELFKDSDNKISLNNLNFINTDEISLKQLNLVNESNELKWLLSLDDENVILQNENSQVVFQSNAATTLIPLVDAINLGEAFKLTTDDIAINTPTMSAKYTSSIFGDITATNFLKIGEDFCAIADKGSDYSRVTILPITL